MNPRKPRTLEGFKAKGTLRKDNNTFSHHVERVTKTSLLLNDDEKREKYNHIWYAKQVDPLLGIRELVAQELFRFLIPECPKTRLIFDGLDKTYILSKEVTGFTPFYLVPNLKENIAQHNITGLGEILPAGIFVLDGDMHCGNIGINEEKKVIKIDGDWSYAILRHYEIKDEEKWSYAILNNYSKKNFTTENSKNYTTNSIISPEDIDSLPYLCNLDYAYNWLDLIKGFQKQLYSNVVDFSLSMDKNFRREVNETLLKLLVLPKDFFKIFALSYIPNSLLNQYKKDIDEMINIFEINHKSFIKAALNTKSFTDYLVSPEAKEQLENFIMQANRFTTTQKKPLVINEFPDNMHQAFADFRSKVNKAHLDSSLQYYPSIENLTRLFEMQPVKSESLKAIINSLKDYVKSRLTSAGDLSWATLKWRDTNSTLNKLFVARSFIAELEKFNDNTTYSELDRLIERACKDNDTVEKHKEKKLLNTQGGLTKCLQKIKDVYDRDKEDLIKERMPQKKFMK